MTGLRVGICGLGTVGSGTFNLLQKNHGLIAGRAGRPVETVLIGCRRDHPDCDLSGTRVSRDIFEVASDPEVDLLVELIGGRETARQLVLQAIDQGKHVVTANKALIAEHGNEIFQAAAERGVSVAFEAAIAGGIPVVKALREGLAGNRIESLTGIINGTSNYILTAMREDGRTFAEVLSEAQSLGYAEADPAFDVEGVDAAHKLAILAAVAFDSSIQFAAVHIEGISQLDPVDLQLADELGYVIKHLGVARRTGSGLEQRVHPTLLPKEMLLASVGGVMNAVQVKSDAAGETLYYGAGAGSAATASAVVADIMDIARCPPGINGQILPGMQSTASLQPVPVQEVETAACLRLRVQDRPGVMAGISGVLSRHDISIDTLLQKQPNDAGLAVICLITNRIPEARLDAALADLEKLPEVQVPVVRIRVEAGQGHVQ